MAVACLRLRALGFALMAAVGAPVAAQACAPMAYTVGPDETVFEIAEAHYGAIDLWSLIFYANQATLSNPLQVPEGTELSIPCPPDGRPIVADATPLRDAGAELTLLTGSNYAPFTDENWPGKGMLTEIVNAAMERTPDPVSYQIRWENDWSQHLFPILDEKVADMGFPWIKPDCAQDPDNLRCANFHFSEPLVEILILLFEHRDRPLTFANDEDIAGARLCRPAGYFTHDLDRPDRLWLTNGLVTLLQPESPEACFALLAAGEVDAVTVNEFLGLTKIHEMGLGGTVQPVRRPLSIEGLHVVISKRHWRGTTFLYRFNAGLADLKASAQYDEIISRHLNLFWDTVN